MRLHYLLVYIWRSAPCAGSGADVEGTKILNLRRRRLADKTAPQPTFTRNSSAAQCGNILWPGEKDAFTFQVLNTGEQPLQTTARWNSSATAPKGALAISGCRRCSRLQTAAPCR